MCITHRVIYSVDSTQIIQYANFTVEWLHEVYDKPSFNFSWKWLSNPTNWCTLAQWKTTTPLHEMANHMIWSSSLAATRFSLTDLFSLFERHILCPHWSNFTTNRIIRFQLNLSTSTPMSLVNSYDTSTRAAKMTSLTALFLRCWTSPLRYDLLFFFVSMTN